MNAPPARPPPPQHNDSAIQNGAIAFSGGALYCLSKQETARVGNYLVMSGVGLELGFMKNG